ncbi:MAG: hypothetical protein ACLQU5_09340 [Isosphaeraceae bacterium]
MFADEWLQDACERRLNGWTIAMPYQLALPNPLPSEGWKVKIHDAENPYEDPHVTIYRKLQKWRLRLRDRTFMDRGASWGDIDDRVRLEIERQWDVLRTEWDRLHGTKNPISSRGPDEEDDNDDNDE